jgi:hypothetical protein
MSEPIDPRSERAQFLFGRGAWGAFKLVGADISTIKTAAKGWAAGMSGIKRPWLVWNAHHDWCYLQQQLVESVGWTPVVGFDPRVGAPQRLTQSAVLLDFNADLRLTFMHPVFVLEFVYLFADKLAFWHSDLLLPVERLSVLAQRFETLQRGETIATSFWRPKRFWRRPDRAWELLGCTTREASRHQFETGTGWWSNIDEHINCPTSDEARRRKKSISWDHGGGILYWKRKYKGRLKAIPLSQIEDGHFSPTSHPLLYKRIGDRKMRFLKEQLDCTIPLDLACSHVGIDLDIGQPKDGG